jgi:ABC-type antimicrobial peptide transport system permease subunit
MGIPLLRGEIPARSGKQGDVRPVLVNQSFARLLWGSDDAVGKAFRQDEFGRSMVMGVVGDVRQRSLAVPPAPEMYVIEGRDEFALGTFVVRTKGRPEDSIASVRQVLRNLDPNLPVNNLMPLRQFAGRTIASHRLALALLAVFGALTLVLAALGLYGVISYLVAQRTPEIGIRMAIGAHPVDVLRLITGAGLRMVAAGIAAGLAAAFASLCLAQSLLYGVGSIDALTFGAVPIVVLVVTLGACLIPAARATRIDPILALRQE